MARKKLKLSKNKMIAGVCAGVGEYLDIDPTAIRVIWLILTVATLGVGGAIIYILAWIIMSKA
jgi:phage shock protein C